MDIESFAKKIKESVENYNNSIETIGSLVKKYADSNLENWQHFSGWSFYNNGEKIILTYSYDDYYSNSSVKYRKILFYMFFEVHRTCHCLFSHSLKFG